MNINVLKPFDNFHMDIVMHTSLVLKGEPNMAELFTRSIDFCKYIKMKPMPDILLNILYEEVSRKSNGFMLKCPVAVVFFF